MKPIIVTLQIDLSKANPELMTQFELDDMTDAELLEWVADWFGDMPVCLIKDRYLDCWVNVINVERNK